MVTVLPEEFDAAQRAFAATQHILHTRAYTAAAPANVPEAEGSYSTVLVRAAGRGTGEAQETASRIIDQFRPDFLIVLGIAGGVQGRDHVALGDAVVPDYIYYGEYMKIVKQHVLRRDGPFDQPSRYLHDLLEPIRIATVWQQTITEARPPAEHIAGPDARADDQVAANKPPEQEIPVGIPKVLIAPLLTTEKILADEENAIQAQLLDFYDHAVAADMESAGFARGVFLNRRDPSYNPQLIVIRGVSDFVQSSNNKEQRELWKAYASDVAARLSRVLAEEILGDWPVESGQGEAQADLRS